MIHVDVRLTSRQLKYIHRRMEWLEKRIAGYSGRSPTFDKQELLIWKRILKYSSVVPDKKKPTI